MQASRPLVCIAGLIMLLTGAFVAEIADGEHPRERGLARATRPRTPESAEAERTSRTRLVGARREDAARTPISISFETPVRGDAGPIPTGAVRTTELVVLACDREERPIPALDLVLQAQSDAGAWRVMRAGQTDASGRLVFSTLAQDLRYRVRAPGGVVAEARPVATSEVVRLSLARPREATVELRTADGYALAGARRVEFHPARAADGPRSVLSPAGRTAQWSTWVVEPVEGTLRVTDSLGRVWSAPHMLAPGETSAATPGAGWIAIAPALVPGMEAARAVEPGRLRWALRFGDGAARRGSGRLAPDGGFHAVVDREQACARGGRIELCWDSGAGERCLPASWYADPALEHIELPPSPVGEEVSLSTSNL